MKANRVPCAVVAACLLLTAAVIAEAHDKDQKRFEKLYYDYLVPDTDISYLTRTCTTPPAKSATSTNGS